MRKSTTMGVQVTPGLYYAKKSGQFGYGLKPKGQYCSYSTVGLNLSLAYRSEEATPALTSTSIYSHCSSCHEPTYNNIYLINLNFIFPRLAKLVRYEKQLRPIIYL